MGTLAHGLVSLAGKGGGNVGGVTAAAVVATLTEGAGKVGAEPFTTAADTGSKSINKYIQAAKQILTQTC